MIQSSSLDSLSFENMHYLDEISQDVRKTAQEPPEYREENRRTRASDAKVAYGVSSYETKDLLIEKLIDAFRVWGHLEAKSYPEGITSLSESRELHNVLALFNTYNASELFPTLGILPKDEAPLSQIISRLQQLYAGRIGYEFKYFVDPVIEKWLENAIEKSPHELLLSEDEKKSLLHHLNKAEVFETFLHTKYVGHKRFSLEGAETLVPMVETLIEKVVACGAQEIYIGMPHRGRLNVLVNILQKSFEDVFAEFEDKHQYRNIGSGDVKYHKGFSTTKICLNGKKVKVAVVANPSHLESVDPVVLGIVRGRQTCLSNSATSVVPVLIHGDAAISGQGVVYESMQMCKLEAYSTSGTIHIIINNHIGFTTKPKDGRSTLYCTDIAKAFGAPVLHVNAEDPESCMYAVSLAVDLRTRFGCDVLIDLNSWRKWGHNESDEPAFTQPLLYQVIRKKPSIRTLYHDRLVKEGLLEQEVIASLDHEFRALLNESYTSFTKKIAENSIEPSQQAQADSGVHDIVQVSGVTRNKVEEIIQKISTPSKDFALHPRIQSQMQERQELMMKNKGFMKIDWGLAEALAFGTLLEEGLSVRLAGQDSRRGTFSHRHGAIFCQKTGAMIYPLRSVANKATFELWDSYLSEYAALGFEYGFTLACPDWLVLWEAQFGDFANGAQIVIDQYIATGEQKWQNHSSLCLLLPHGYEGQGPEHSSGRIERFLILCAEQNMTVVYPTTTAQLFHLLRMQAWSHVKRPLVVFTPKGLLRFQPSFSTMNDMCESTFSPILVENTTPKHTETLIFCSGRIYYDLETHLEKSKETIAIIRIERLYPFPDKEIRAILKECSQIKRVLWVQEEPENMGAYSFCKKHLEQLIDPKHTIEFIGREASSAPACGSHELHQQQQEAIIAKVFGSNN